MARAAVVLVAILVAAAPVPAALVERYYSAALYPLWQAFITSVSNLVPIALLDALVICVAAAWIALAVVDIRRRASHGGTARALAAILARTIVWSAALYLVFVASWGLNYRRVRLMSTLQADDARITGDRVRQLASAAAGKLNGLHRAAHAAGWPDAAAIDPALPAAFAAAQRDLGATRLAVPARPKHTLLDLYFRRAVVDGMTDPFFLETLVVSDLVPLERPFVMAHEWAHLAGYADEGEANFVAWLACLHAGEPAQYSGWIFLFNEAGATLPRADRQELASHLDAGPRADLRAIADRVNANRSVRVSQAGWQVYNQYLKANRVEAGAASYAEVIRLILGTRFAPI